MAQLDVIDAAGSQFRVGHDATNYVQFSSSSTGDLTIAPTGGDTSITGSLTVTSDVIASVIRRGTADGADSESVQIYGGGASGDSRGAYIRVYGNEAGGGAGGTLDLIAGNAAGGKIAFYSGGAERARLTDGGVWAIGTSVTTSALAGWLGLANGKALAWVNGAGTSMVDCVSLDASDRLNFNMQNNPIVLSNSGFTATAAGAYAGKIPVSIGGTTYYISLTA